MNMRQLKYFLSIAETGSLVEAARRFDVSQPTLSRALKLLENHLGMRLFLRHGRGVRLTRDGQYFHDAIIGHVAGLERAMQEVLARKSGFEGTVRLGWVGTMSIPLGSDIISSFTRCHPHVELHARIGSSTQVIDWVSTGVMDIGVMNSERPAAGHFADTLARAMLYLVTAYDGDVEHCDISFADALRYPMFVHSQQNALGRIIRHVAHDQGLALRIVAEIDDITAVLPIIAQGESAAIIPKGLLAGTHDLALNVRRIIDPDLWIYFHLAISKTGKKKPAVRQLAQKIRSEATRYFKTCE